MGDPILSLFFQNIIRKTKTISLLNFVIGNIVGKVGMHLSLNFAKPLLSYFPNQPSNKLFPKKE